ncbi:hypothetical protein NEUTE1DRAFT_106170 [Neurospora tetrasperma FGSC 2508]|uniref:Uncharacterized protein n=1 Tax=Neurospora tetrasperma (strain FGSC 2508 / ATCC MYA-4615 / P0657) TaxID=510951 RepID=F8N218_NEUT8|nr:uncharacterized protein NEUTE1DRAFT_106170 [Neurospora tetrasperma FGSC 2508]EGO53242.1 hypothetical protein NEUTE1DRAFT_106170 [Neurospora tetrasperma FGSC 2508]
MPLCRRPSGLSAEKNSIGIYRLSERGTYWYLPTLYLTATSISRSFKVILDNAADSGLWTMEAKLLVNPMLALRSGAGGDKVNR